MSRDCVSADRGGAENETSYRNAIVTGALVCPATLNLIGKLANGLCDDLLTCILFASKAPVILAPAMNTGMFEHPVTRENMAKLKKLGIEFVGPAHGELACREVGMGHIAETQEILAAVHRRLKNGRKKG